MTIEGIKHTSTAELPKQDLVSGDSKRIKVQDFFSNAPQTPTVNKRWSFGSTGINKGSMRTLFQRGNK